MGPNTIKPYQLLFPFAITMCHNHLLLPFAFTICYYHVPFTMRYSHVEIRIDQRMFYPGEQQHHCCDHYAITADNAVVAAPCTFVAKSLEIIPSVAKSLGIASMPLWLASPTRNFSLEIAPLARS